MGWRTICMTGWTFYAINTLHDKTVLLFSSIFASIAKNLHVCSSDHAVFQRKVLSP